MYISIYVQKTKIKTDLQARKKGIKFLTLPKMNNQRAHTEADKERGGQFIGKVSPPSFN